MYSEDASPVHPFVPYANCSQTSLPRLVDGSGTTIGPFQGAQLNMSRTGIKVFLYVDTYSVVQNEGSRKHHMKCYELDILQEHVSMVTRTWLVSNKSMM